MTTYFLSLFLLLFGGCQPEEIHFDTQHPVTKVEATQYGTPFSKVPETSEIIMYEVNPLVFSPQRNLKGVQNRLDEIKELGVNVIWLMPIHPIGEERGFGSPYAVKNFFEINPRYGTLEDLRELVAEAHDREMAVILDLVANHTSWDNEWITKNKSWYSQDSEGNIIMAENWSDVAELNYDNQSLRNEMIKVMEYWVLEANIDGFRCDFADGVPVTFWTQAIQKLRGLPNRDIIMFAEASSKNMFNADFDMIFGWGFYHRLKEIYEKNEPVNQIFAANTNDYNNVPSGKEILRFVTNHDDHIWDDIPQNIFNGNAGVMAAYVITSYLGGVPMIYNGQEVGIPNSIPFFYPTNFTIDWTINSTLKSEYGKVNRLRNESIALQKGTVQNLQNHQDILAFKRSFSGEEKIVLVNVRNQNIEYDLPSSMANTTWTNSFTGESVNLGTTIEMAPYAYYVFNK